MSDGGEEQAGGHAGRMLFLGLVDVFGDSALADMFSQRACVEKWLEVERVLALSQAEFGLIPLDAARAIEHEVRVTRIDFDRLWNRTRVVGYPILPLIEQVVEGSPAVVAAYLHWGATTQDIMDTGLALQIRDGLDRIEELLYELGTLLVDMAQRHRGTTITGRTHAQPAVPTTFGAKLAVWLSEFARHRDRLRAVRPRVAVVQLFGAAGTAAALGTRSRELRHHMAARLGLEVTDVAWHTARDSLAELTFVLAAIAATCGKIGREVRDLSRPEIGELREVSGHLRGASSTMPQKANPIDSESIIGMSILSSQTVPALLHAMQGGHERAAGEWQVEWDTIPNSFSLTAGALALAHHLMAGLQVFPERMASNVRADGGLVMAEALMMKLAPAVGRARAHDLVYQSCAAVREHGTDLVANLRTLVDGELVTDLDLEAALDPATYLGEAEYAVDTAVEQWHRAWSAD